MASGLCAALTGRTHGCTDQPANVKKTLANSEPFSNRISVVKSSLCSSLTLAPGVMVLSAVGIGRRIIRF